MAVRRPLHLAAAGLAAALLLTGCTSPAPRPTTTATPTATATATATTSATASATASASAVPAASATPSASTAAAGCPADNGESMPGATFRATADLDGDGRADRVFSERAKGEFGIVTASGAHLSLMYESASPDTRVAWAARIGGVGILMTADGREATMWSIQRGSGGRCSLFTVRNAQGKPYEFLLQRQAGPGSGVGCRTENGRTVLGGYDVAPVTATTSRVTFTHVAVSADGRVATNGTTEVLAKAAPDGSAVVTGAEGSDCLDAALVTLPD